MKLLAVEDIVRCFTVLLLFWKETESFECRSTQSSYQNHQDRFGRPMMKYNVVSVSQQRAAKSTLAWESITIDRKTRGLANDCFGYGTTPDVLSKAGFSTALFSETSGSGSQSKKTTFLARLRWFLLFPLRLFILKPLKHLTEIVVDTLDDDGTVVVAENVVVEQNASSVTPPLSDTSKQTDGSYSVVTTSGLEVDTETVVPNDKKADKEEQAIPRAISERTAIEDSASKIIHAIDRPEGERWAVAAPGLDLSGEWELIVTEEFRSDYDNYLEELGQPLLVRTVALGIIGRTTEETQQTDGGKSLLIRGRNVRGVWDRTLVASGTEVGKDEYSPLQIPVMTADSEKVEAECWWEEEGNVHVSWLRGVTKYGGGAFESRRYLQDDMYVCESKFHPSDKSRNSSSITWRFRRQNAGNS